MATGRAASAETRDAFLKLVEKEVREGWSFMAACGRAKVPYPTAYTWSKTYRDWNQVAELATKLKVETRGGARG